MEGRIQIHAIFENTKLLFKAIVFALSFNFNLVAQPGPEVIFPTNITLNQYPSFVKGFPNDSLALSFGPPILGIITIDSTSDLSIIPLLKNEKKLRLKFNISKIPEGFIAFENTKSLQIINLSDSADISFLNEFKNLESLELENIGDIIFSKHLMLDSLKEIEVCFSERLSSLKAIEKINSLEKLNLRYVPHLKQFPVFDTTNQIKYVRIYQEIGDGCTDCKPNLSKMDISYLNRLKHLEELDLSNVNGITKVPDDLSKNLRIFKIFDIQRANKDYAIRSYIQDLSGFSKYEKLETIELSGVHIKEFNGNFGKLNLKKLIFRWVYGLEDLSGIFTFHSIDEVKIEKCEIRIIEGGTCNATINKMLFEDCSGIEKIDFLLSCEHINYLQLGGGPLLLLTKPEEWKLPNLSIYAQGKAGKFYVRKKDGKIVESLNLSAYLRY